MSWVLLGVLGVLMVLAIIYNRFYANRCPWCGSTEIIDLTSETTFACMEPWCPGDGKEWEWQMWQRYRRREP